MCSLHHGSLDRNSGWWVWSRRSFHAEPTAPAQCNMVQHQSSGATTEEPRLAPHGYFLTHHSRSNFPLVPLHVPAPVIFPLSCPNLLGAASATCVLCSPLSCHCNLTCDPFLLLALRATPPRRFAPGYGEVSPYLYCAHPGHLIHNPPTTSRTRPHFPRHPSSFSLAPLATLL